MKRLLALLSAGGALAIATPGQAQDHSGHDMGGMQMPAPAAKPAPRKPSVRKPAARPAPARPAPRATKPPAPRPATPTEPQGTATTGVGMDHKASEPMDHSTMDHSGMDHGAMPGMEAQATNGHDTGGMPAMEMTGTALPAGNAPPPPVPSDHYADRQFPASEMARSRNEMMRGQGGNSFGLLALNIFEYQAHSGRDGYRWDGEGWYGGDINRLWMKSEGEGEFGGRLDSGEVQVLYSRAIDPYFNLQAGVRQDFGPSPKRTYATVGFEGLAPGMFEVEGGVFLSNKGDLLARIEGYYDQRLTQRLVLQPRAEVNLSAQDVPENDIGAGLVNLELGLRLRYELSRQFAPYVGVSYYRKFGDTAQLAEAAGEDVHATSFVAGVRFWF